jgi:hypothetical protein
MAFPPSFDNAWDITTPPDTQAANQLGLDIRNLKDDIMQRLSLLSGIFANRPTPETVNAVWGGSGFGLLYFATDTGQIFQWNGAAWVQVSFGTVIAKFDALGQSATIAATTLYTPTAAGFYRASMNIAIQSPVGSSQVVGQILFTQNGHVITLTPVNSAPLVFGSPSGIVALYSDSGQPIQYAVPTWNSGGVGDTYDIHVRLEAL